MATETVRVNPDLAAVDVGYRNYAKTKDLAFEDNVRVANRITKALLDVGIPKDKIESESLQLGDASRRWDENAPKEERIEAHQSWKVRVAAQDAQKVVDLVVAAGANEIDDVNWIVAHPLELEAKANSAALAKARALAERMAKESGVKVGDLLFLSNSLFQIGRAHV